MKIETHNTFEILKRHVTLWKKMKDYVINQYAIQKIKT